MKLDPKVMRYVRREGGVYTLEKPVDLLDDRDLCQACGVFDLCPIQTHFRDLNWARFRTRDCARYVPILTFSPPIIGLTGDFNTMRLGTAWAEKLSPGTSRVALVNGRTLQVLGYASVREIVAGPFDEMVEAHAATNHLCVHTNPPDPVAVVGKVLKGAYGKFMRPSAELTVIFLRRLDAQEG